ncbi:hypothetical protein N9K75_02595 [bacterium]|nr:hypothetical protein [bacterium]
MMDKQQALEKILELQAFVEELDRPKAVSGLKGFGIPDVGHYFHLVSHTPDGKFEELGTTCTETGWGSSYGLCQVPVAFTKEAAERFANMLNVFLELRQCEGVEAVGDEKEQWIIDGTGCVVRWLASCDKAGVLAPCFDTFDQAQAALDKIGKDRFVDACEFMGGL